ncbi:hypothetical protein SOVF_198980 [Spinacia oleracea]|uniref:Delta(7)-sterol-C5(6)-desaturase n=1 Tax=Spinacia oleracea TaxID=3562 RepID=A0A9R0ICR0_SPIOL|nr:delta(7)-sterol-C5(6)-desaturase-like [Spinacia oleracea]KNA04521.1 hypothetical protein SOVF_198980 [Spinacia oleracea]
MSSEKYMKLLVEESTWYNEMLLPQIARDVLPHFLQSWLRNCICGVFVFIISTLLLRFNYWKYHSSSPKENVATRKEMIKQIKESMELMPSGALFLTVTEYLAETGWTRCYTRISDVGLGIYILSTLVYLAVIEVWTYWIHRYMHEIRPIYKHIHSRHHSYNKESSLSPFAGWALHPLDGILMELPHGIAFLMVPTHFFTHLALYLTEAMWGVLVHGKGFKLRWPFMDGEFHTIHHTACQNNYGNFTICMDKWFGTLRPPKESIQVKKEN